MVHKKDTFWPLSLSLVFQILLLWKGWWNEDILFVFKPDSKPGVVKDGSAPESLKDTREATTKYAVFWHSTTLSFTAAAKSEQLLLTFPCHFLALLKGIGSSFSLPMVPSAGHLDSQTSFILSQYFLYFINDMVDSLGNLWQQAFLVWLQWLSPKKTRQFNPRNPAWVRKEILYFFIELQLRSVL